MLNIFQVGKTYNPRKILTLFAAKADSDEEDFDESNFILQQNRRTALMRMSVLKMNLWKTKISEEKKPTQQQQRKHIEQGRNCLGKSTAECRWQNKKDYSNQTRNKTIYSC